MWARGRKKGNSIIVFPEEYVVFDLETTGLDPDVDEIIEIGALRIRNGVVVDSYTTLVKPSSYDIIGLDWQDQDDYIEVSNEKRVYIPSFITELTGITNQMIKDAPTIEKPITKLVDFIGNSIIVGYNVNFDLNFAYDAFYEVEEKPISNDFMDVKRMARKLLRQLKNHKLETLCDYFGIDKTDEHRALGDCLLTEKCFQKLKQLALELYGTEEEFIRQFRPKTKKLSVKDIVPDESLKDEESPFFDKEVVVTGTLKKFDRAGVLQLIANIGGRPKNTGVTKKTSFLVIANEEYRKETNKKKTARKYLLEGQDIQILSENVFYEMLGIEEDE